jgi:hypothetical protein
MRVQLEPSPPILYSILRMTWQDHDGETERRHEDFLENAAMDFVQIEKHTPLFRRRAATQQRTQSPFDMASGAETGLQRDFQRKPPC